MGFRLELTYLFPWLALIELRAHSTLEKIQGGDQSGGAGTGGFLWQPSLIEGRPNTFLGYPIYNEDNMDDLSDTEGVIAIFGNFQYGYRILDRQGITVQRLSELYAEAGLVGFKVHARVGGYPIRPSNKVLVLLTKHAYGGGIAR